jgi:hypothetical protein
MNVSFSTAALAALCSSEQQLVQRWGPEIGRTVGRRLLDLCATDADALDRLPGARVSANGTGETTIAFGEHIVVRGVISSGSTPGRRLRPVDDDNIMITSLDARGSDQ